MIVYHEICTVARNVEISSFTQKLYFDNQNPAILSGDLVTIINSTFACISPITLRILK